MQIALLYKLCICYSDLSSYFSLIPNIPHYKFMLCPTLKNKNKQTTKPYILSLFVEYFQHLIALNESSGSNNDASPFIF